MFDVSTLGGVDRNTSTPAPNTIVSASPPSRRRGSKRLGIGQQIGDDFIPPIGDERRYHFGAGGGMIHAGTFPVDVKLERFRIFTQIMQRAGQRGGPGGTELVAAFRCKPCDLAQVIEQKLPICSTDFPARNAALV